MGSNINFSNYGNEPPGDGGGGRQPGGGSENFPLIRQSSIYSLTFDEFQNTLGGVGKDFGSMNMDELLKNIWSAEETQPMTATSAAAAASESGGGYNLQRQGSLTLPRTLSLRKVDEVWKDIAKDNGGDGSTVPQRQQTLGEVTLEEFLMRAGVVKEDTQPFGKPSLGGSGIFGDLAPSRNNGDLGFGINFQQPGHNMNMLSTNLPLNVNGARTPQRQPTQTQQPLQQQRQQPLFPKQPAVSYGIKNGLMPNSVFQGGGGGMIVPSGSPATLSSDGLAKSNGDTSSVSPVLCAYNGGYRGRRSDNTVNKVVERRQRRMIKNRESAARSRARKQAYTMELEQEIAKLKEDNEELRRKMAEIMEMQKNQAVEMVNAQPGPRKRLRRTQTGMW